MRTPARLFAYPSSAFTDTDVLIWEGDASDPTLKPPEMYTLLENFCLGLRRLEVFGRARTVRRGWVTALAEGEEERIEEGMTLGRDDGSGEELQEGAVRFSRERWEAQVKEVAEGQGRLVVPMTAGDVVAFARIGSCR